MRNDPCRWRKAGQNVSRDGSARIRCRLRAGSVAAALTAVALLCAATAGFTATPASILLIDSYHPEYRWSEQVGDGIRDAINEAVASPRLYVEHLDSKRVSTPAVWDRLAGLIREKYRGIKIDVVITADDNALLFLKQYRQSLFDRIPAVFCGANDLRTQMLDGMAPITGVNEAADIKDTVEIALRLLPETRRIVVVNDTSPTGRNVRREIQRIAETYSDRITFAYFEDLARETLLERLKALGTGDIVLYTFFLRDGDGRYYDYDDSARKICSAASVPVFGLWEFNLGLGIVGGKLVSGYAQGLVAGRMAVRIIDGEGADAIPLVTKSPNRYAFDYLVLERFHLDRARLPAGSLIINPPESFYHRHKMLLWGALAVFFFLLSLSLFLSVLLTKGRSRQQLLQKQRRFLENITGNLPAVVYQFSIGPGGSVTMNYVNRKAAQILGIDVPLDAFYNAFCERIHEDDRPRFVASIDNAGKTMTPWTFEGRYIKPSGTLIWFSGNAAPYRENGRILYDGMIMDITRSKMAEEKLRTSHRLLQEREELLGFFVSYTPIAVAMCDLEMNYLYYSRRWIIDFKLPDEDLTGRCHYDVFGPIPDHWKADHQRCLKGESIRKEEEAFIRADGSIEWVRRILYPWRTSTDKIGGIIILAEVTTAKKQAELAAREMENRLQAIGDNVPGGLLYQQLIRPDGTRRFTYVSGNVQYLTGCTAEQVIADENRLYGRVLPEDLEKLVQAETATVGTLSIVDETVRLRRKSGKIGWQRLVAKPRRLPDGDVLLDGISLDVTTLKRAEARLRTMQRVVENSPVVLFRWRAADGWPVVYVSENVRQFGYSPEALVSGEVPYADLIHPDDWMAVAREVTNHADAGSTQFQQEYRIVTRSGEIRWVDDRTVVERDSEGRISHYQGVVLDISERKKAQEENHKRQQFLESVLYHAPDAIITLDDRHRVVDWNPGAANIFGYTRAEAIGNHLTDLVAGTDAKSQVEQNIQTALAGQRVDAYEAVRYRKDGKPVSVIVAGSPIIIDNSLTGLVVMYTDITALKQAEAEVKRNERMLRRIIDMVPSIIFVKNAQGRFLMVNQAMAASYGMTVDDLVGKFQSDVHPDPDQVQHYLLDDRQTIETGQPLLGKEEPFSDHTGARRWLEVTKLPCDTGDFGEPAVVGLASDITERRQVEAMLRISQFSFDKAAIGIYWIASDSRIINANEHAARMLGYTREELSGLSVCDLDPEVDMADWASKWQDLRALGKDRAERIHRRKDGSTIPVEIHFNLMEYNGEEFSISFVHDITDRREAEARIQESEKRYRMIFESTGTGTVLVEADMTLIMVNREFTQMVGYTRDEIEGKMKWSEFVPADELERVKRYHASRREDSFNTPNQYECRIVDRAGRIKPMMLKVGLIPDTRISIAAFLDISDRKRTEEALLAANRMLRLVLDTIPVHVFWKDTDCRYLGCNRPFAENAGFSEPEALIGRNDYELAWVDQAAAYRRDDLEVMETERARLNYEEKQTTASGKTVWLLTSKVPMRDSRNQVIGILGTFQDITESKQANEERQRLRNYLSNIIDSMPSVLIGVDNELRVTQWNKQAEKHTGQPFDQAHMQPLDQAFPRLTDALDRIRGAIRDRRVIRSLKNPRQFQGKTQFEDITIFPLEDNGVEGAVIRLDDVTEQVRMQEMMIQSEKMLSVGGLAAGMAHEINNPLAGILQNTAVLENRLFGDLPANHKAADATGIDLAALRQYLELRGMPTMLENIRSSGNRAAAIVKNMLSFARKSERVVSSHALGSLLDQTIELARTDYDMKKHYDFKQIQIVREYDDAAPPVPCEPSKIQQVLLNILKNGAEAMAEAMDKNAPPRFVLRVKDDGPWVRIEIEDNGPGMDDATRRRIFEPFFTTKPVGRGTGLGLSVSYFIIAENHGGNMDAHAIDEGGTRFIIQLPKTGKPDGQG